MSEYLKAHEAFVRAALAGEACDLTELKAFHDRQIAWMQHERLIHLLVTLAVALFSLLVLAFALVHEGLTELVLTVLLLGLLSAYIAHYFRLENGVQRWYHLANRIDGRLGVVSADYEGGGASST